MYPLAYKTTSQNHAISWSFSRSDCNGKEKDYESGFHYYGARYYWSELLTSWISVDPMMDKYPQVSPYAYCAWNPIRFIDPDGEKPRLFFHGSQSKSTFINIVNSGLGGQFQARLTQDAHGWYYFDIVGTKGGGDIGKLTDRQRSFYDAIKNCIDAKNINGKELNYDIDVYYGSSNITIGKYSENSIDVADMNQFNNLDEGGATKQGKLTHEFAEQCKKAFWGNKKGEEMGRMNCHKYACIEEGKVNGNWRDYTKDKTIARNKIQETYVQNGKEHHVTITKTPIINVAQ